jgi:hypothetical protein
MRIQHSQVVLATGAHRVARHALLVSAASLCLNNFFCSGIASSSERFRILWDRRELEKRN